MQKMTTKRVLISAGEASGDLHAANLVEATTKVAPNIEFYGMGSGSMQKVGVNIIVDARKLSVFGYWEIVTTLLKILRAYFTMRRAILRDKPDLLILVDYPGFNLRLAKVAKKAGVKVLYFISPKIWAWHQSRVKIIKECVDMMAVIFPFEVDFYQKWQIPVKFVDNHLMKLIENRLSLEKARQLFNIDPNNKVIGLFPGSRKSEIKRLLPVMLEAAKILKEKNPNIQFLLPKASSIDMDQLEPELQTSNLPIQVITGHNYDVMQVSDAIITASGTATLEIALIGTPLVIIYRLSWPEYQLAKRIIKIPYAGLCNILAGKEVAKELLQYDATPEKIAAEIDGVLNDQAYRNRMKDELANIKKSLKNKEITSIANLVIEMIQD